MSHSNQHSRMIFGLEICKNSHPDIRRIKRDSLKHGNIPSIHGNKFWGSSYLLMDYFREFPLAANARVLEVGCGWGLGGIYLAKHYAALLTSTDADAAVFPYLQLHAELNGVSTHMEQACFDDISTQRLGEFDVLIAADICFWDELSDSVYQLIARAVAAGVKKIVIADPEREPFFAMAERCMEDFYAELEARKVSAPHRSSGCLLVIENS